jgi:hypothetical protein
MVLLDGVMLYRLQMLKIARRIGGMLGIVQWLCTDAKLPQPVVGDHDFVLQDIAALCAVDAFATSADPVVAEGVGIIRYELVRRAVERGGLNGVVEMMRRLYTHRLPKTTRVVRSTGMANNLDALVCRFKVVDDPTVGKLVCILADTRDAYWLRDVYRNRMQGLEPVVQYMFSRVKNAASMDRGDPFRMSKLWAMFAPLARQSLAIQVALEIVYAEALTEHAGKEVERWMVADT